MRNALIMNIYLSILILLVVQGLSEPLRYLDMEDASIDGNWDLTDNGITYKCNTKGLQNAPELVGNAYRGNTCLKYSIDSHVSTKKTDKIEHIIVESGAPDPILFRNSPHLTYQGPYFVGFAVKFDPDFATEAPWEKYHHKTMMWQVWQTDGDSPPIAMAPDHGAPDGQLKMELHIRDDSNAKVDFLPYRHAMSNVNKGHWYAYVIEMVPAYIDDPNGEGYIKVWRDGQLDLEYAGHWGYKPTNLGGEDWNQLATMINIYRDYDNPYQCVYFDEVAYGLSYEDVDPSGLTRTVSSRSNISVSFQRQFGGQGGEYEIFDIVGRKFSNPGISSKNVKKTVGFCLVRLMNYNCGIKQVYIDWPSNQ